MCSLFSFKNINPGAVECIVTFCVRIKDGHLQGTGLQISALLTPCIRLVGSRHM